VPEVVGLEHQPLRIEAVKGLLEARPFVLDHAPGEAGAEHPLRHLGENAVVLQLAERLRIRLWRQQARQRLGAAFALLGAGTDGLERRHAAARLGCGARRFD
jgi:hypothetical protein